MESTSNSYTLHLSRLHCYFIEENEYDDVYLIHDGEKIWPKNRKQQPIMMDTTTELDVDVKNISKNQEVVIELWDWDFLSPNDKLGTFTMIVEGEPGPFSTDMVQNPRETTKAKYTLDWEVI
ncbi:MAG: hypothetical protein MI975_17700 [Cytophagales bacterium]|nr:hypothetical protein [Cytophagales bacterium]